MTRSTPRSASVLFAVSFGLVAGCVREHLVELRIDGSAIAGEIAATELVVIADGRCPSEQQLAEGSAPYVVHHQRYRRSEPPRPIGRLAPGIYAFAVLARDSSCFAVGYGCSVASVGEDPAVSIALGIGDGSVGTCARCEEGLCEAEPPLPDGGPLPFDSEGPPDGGPLVCGVSCDLLGGDWDCCDGTCVDLSRDLGHCGSCGWTCGGEGGQCCDGDCADTTTDLYNCGVCGHVCAGDEECFSGACLTL